MKIRDVECFAAVADTLHFGLAASRLGVRTSVVSEHVRDLEAELGVPLFTRTSRRVTLTPAGESLLPTALEILAAGDRLQEEARRLVDGQNGALQFAYAAGARDLAIRVMRSLLISHPELNVVPAALTHPQIVEALLTGRADVGLSVQADHERLRWTPLWERPRADTVAVPCSSPLASKSSIRLEDLEGERVVILPRETHPGLHDSMRSWFEDAGVQPNFRPYPLTNETDSLALVAAGFCSALCVRPAEASHYEGQIAFLPIENFTKGVEFGVLVVEGDHQPAVGTFIDAVAALCSLDSALE